MTDSRDDFAAFDSMLAPRGRFVAWSGDADAPYATATSASSIVQSVRVVATSESAALSAPAAPAVSEAPDVSHDHDHGPTGHPPGGEPEVVVNDYTALLSGSSWQGYQTTGRPVFLTYSFETSAQPYLAGESPQPFINSFQPLGEADKATTRAALQQWADVSGIVFFEVPAGQGDLRFGRYNFALDPDYAGFGGYAYYPGTSSDLGVESLIGGDVFLNTQNGPTNHIGLILHEIGHALGFKHPFEGDPTLATGLDHQSQTVMSYTGPTASVLGPLDIQAIQHVYGLNSADGTQVASFNWNSTTFTLTQSGAAGADRIRGVGTSDLINGLGGNDTLFGGYGNDTLEGGDGADRLNGGGGNDTLDGGAGNDYIGGDAGANDADAGDDVLSGGAGLSDTLDGHAGNDWLSDIDGGFLRGGLGNDTYDLSINAANIYITENAGAGIDTIRAGITINLANYPNVENVALTGSANVNAIGTSADNALTGNSGNNELTGGAGNDTLSGGGGNDGLNGGDGVDILRGGAGNDVYINPLSSEVIELAGQGFDRVISDSSFSLATLSYVERLELTGNIPGFLRANNFANHLIGNSGSNTMLGFDGDDAIFGGGGRDTITGGMGRDQIAPGLERDTIVWNSVAESTGATRDFVSEFIFNVGGSAYESLDFHIVPTGVRAMITTGVLNEANFDANLQTAVNATNLGANQAVLFDPNGGDLNVTGHVYLIVDANGQAGYQAGQDYVVQFTSYYGTLTLANFI